MPNRRSAPGSNQYQRRDQPASQLDVPQLVVAWLQKPNQSSGLVAARTVLLDTYEALGPQSQALIVIGAQAVYANVPAGTDQRLVALAATDSADFAVDPALISDQPDIAQALQRCGFRPLKDRPGIWKVEGRDKLGVDLLVPEAVAGPGRRSVRVNPHQDRQTFGRCEGIELALLDNRKTTISGFELDTRQIEMNVAGPAALLCAKVYKLRDRFADTARAYRIRPKDASDVYLLMQTVTPAAAAGVWDAAMSDQRIGLTVRQGVGHFAALFGLDGPAVDLAGQAAAGPVVAYQQVVDFVRDWSDEFIRLSGRSDI